MILLNFKQPAGYNSTSVNNSFFSVLFWNVHGLKNIYDLDTATNHILCISETWEPSVNFALPLLCKNWHRCISPACRTIHFGRYSGGLLSLSNTPNTPTILSSCENWIFHKSTILETNVIVGSVYFKPNQTSFNLVLDSLQIVIDKIIADEDYDCFIIGGDFNARVGSFLHEDSSLLEGSCLISSRTSHDKESNPQGSSLMDFMCSNGFILLNVRTPGDSRGDYTFSNARGKSTIDLVWVNSLSINRIKDMWIPNIVTKSDHFPVEVSLFAANPSSPAPCFSHNLKSHSCSLKWRPTTAHIFKNSMLFSPLIAVNFDTATTNNLCKVFCNAINNAAKDVGMCMSSGSTSNSGNLFHSKSRYDDQCKARKRVTKLLLQRCKADGHSSILWPVFHHSNKEYFALIKNKSLQFQESLTRNLHDISRRN